MVPRSFTAAFLAGLVIGCALAGFEVARGEDTALISTLSAILGRRIDANGLLPALIVVGLAGGARAAAMTMLVAHTLLEMAARRSYDAYAFGGAAAAAMMAALSQAMGHPPGHGWGVELLAGAGTGLLYRIFAGSRPPDK